ncbi:MAG: glycosyltransferase [Acidobacteriota bacterium]|nr:glycosyltransferase [Acidobacteriota bacterium]
MTKVSVIIPTHCRPHLLPYAVKSAQQAGENVEVIVIDDASNDSTPEVCRSLTGIKYIRLDLNQGVAGARNVGILASSGEYISFLDDDDLRLPGSLDLQIKALETFPEAGFVCGSAHYADQDGKLTGHIASPKGEAGDLFWRILGWDYFLLPATVVIRKACFLSIGLLNSRLRGIDDWDLWVRLSELFPLAVVDQPVGVYRKPTPFSEQGSSKLAAHLLRAADLQLHHLRLPRALAAPGKKRKQVRRETLNRYADTMMWNAAERFPEGAFRFALLNALGALRLSPLRVIRPGPYKLLLKGFLPRQHDARDRTRFEKTHRIQINTY